PRTRSNKSIQLWHQTHGRSEDAPPGLVRVSKLQMADVQYGGLDASDFDRLSRKPGIWFCVALDFLYATEVLCERAQKDTVRDPTGARRSQNMGRGGLLPPILLSAALCVENAIKAVIAAENETIGKRGRLAQVIAN